MTPTPLRVIAIDGPAGSGKSTVARTLAQHLGLQYLDTGAMYRCVAFAALAQDIDPADEQAVTRIARTCEIQIEDTSVKVNGMDVTTQIRGPEVTRSVSTVSSYPGVREVLRQRQRHWATQRGGGVVEGRDIGTAVFPEAELKVYLSASPEVRAERRAREVADLRYEAVAADLARRDAADSARQHDPLAPAPDALHIDTTHLDVQEVVQEVIARLSPTRPTP